MTTYANGGTAYNVANVVTPWFKGLEFDGSSAYVDLAEDVVSNGGFDSGSYWTAGALSGWSIAGGKAVKTGSLGFPGPYTLTQTVTPILAGELYRVTYDVDTWNGHGAFGVTVGGNPCGEHAATGVFVDYVYCAAAIDSIALYATSDACGISVKYIKVERVDRVFSQRQITIAGWFKATTDTVAVQGLVTNGSSGTDFQGLYLYDSQWSFTSHVAGVEKSVSATATLGRWTFVCATREYDGVTTTIRLYVDGVLAATKTGTGAPNVSNYGTPMLGWRTAAEFFDGQMADNVTIRAGAASAAWVAAEYARGIAAVYAGPYAEQLLAAPVTGSRKLYVRAWSDLERRAASVPMMMVKDSSGDWDPLGSALGDIDSENEELSYTAANGISGVRLYSKFTTGLACFDDVDFADPDVTAAQIPARLRQKFVKMVCRGKPLHSWAAAVIEWT